MTVQAVVADDEPHVLRLLGIVLQKQEVEAACADNGEEALRLVREHAPALVLLDAMMPRLNGWEVCEQIRADEALARQPYVIMLTASGHERDRHRAEEVGVDEFVTKPFSPSHLGERIQAALATSGP